MKCSLCGYEFTKAEMEDKKCRACPMKCGSVCCPHCGYMFVEESKIINAIRRLFRWKGK